MDARLISAYTTTHRCHCNCSRHHTMALSIRPAIISLSPHCSAPGHLTQDFIIATPSTVHTLAHTTPIIISYNFTECQSASQPQVKPSSSAISKPPSEWSIGPYLNCNSIKTLTTSTFIEYNLCSSSCHYLTHRYPRVVK